MENEIREFFRQTAPKPADPTAFKLELNARLAAIEQVKAFRDREIRHARRMQRIAFAVGLVLGGAAAAFLILHPVQLPTLIGSSALTEGVSPLAASLINWGIPTLIGGLAIFIPLRIMRRQRRTIF